MSTKTDRPSPISSKDLYTAIKRTDYRQAIADVSHFPGLANSSGIRINASHYTKWTKPIYNHEVFLAFDLTNDGQLVKVLNDDPYVHLSFKNSARDRIGVFIKVDTSEKYHEWMADRLRDYMKVNHGIEALTGLTLNKSVPISYDPDAYLNENSKIMCYDMAHSIIDEKWKREWEDYVAEHLCTV